jgi:peptide alpha-N-acetyltransferase
MVGVIVGKLDVHKSHGQLRGYIAMLAVDKNCRQQGIGSTLVNKVGQTLKTKGAQEVSIVINFIDCIRNRIVKQGCT